MPVIFSRSDICKATDQRTYRKALDYVKNRSISFWDIGSRSVRGVVIGTLPYLATFKVDTRSDGSFHLTGQCTCPASDGKYLCKHAVALGLKVLECECDRQDGAVVEAFLGSRSHIELIDIIQKQAINDKAFFDKLKIDAVSDRIGPYPDASGFQEVILLLLAQASDDRFDPDNHAGKIDAILTRQLNEGDPVLAARGALSAAVYYDQHPIQREDDFYENTRFNDDDEDGEFSESDIDDALPFFEIHASAMLKSGAEAQLVLNELRSNLSCFKFFPERVDVYENCFGVLFASELKREIASHDS